LYRPNSTALRSGRTLSACVLLFASACLLAQTPEEHAKHHGSAESPSASPTAPAGPAGATAAPGVEIGSGDTGCGGAGCMRGPARQLYPTLMALPDLPLEQRADIERQAHARMIEGTRQMTVATSGIAAAVERQDFARMQESSAQLGAALDRFESGLAAHRALAEGQAPRNIALRWFKRQMNLMDPIASPPPHGIFGLSSFHYFAMALLAVFAALASWMYVARNRRVSTMLASLRTSGSLPGTNTPSPPRPTPGSATEPPLQPTTVQTRVPPSTTGNWAGKLRVARIFRETPTTKTFRLVPMEAPAPLPFVFEPGQFLTVAVTVDGKTARRSYSIASSPCCQGWCEITVKHESGGIVSGYLDEQVAGGDLLEVSGPYGRFTFRGQEAPSVVFIAGGVGVTPLMSSIRYLTDQSWNGRIDLLYACARLDSVIFREELAYLAARHPNLHVTFVLSDEPPGAWTGARGFITAELLNCVPDIRSRLIHLCGPPGMMGAVKNELGTLGVAQDSIKTELFLGVPKPKAPPSGSVPEDDVAPIATCNFARSKKGVPLRAGQTVLEAAEENGVAIEYQCRQGYCGVCKVKLLAGNVSMEIQDALTPVDKASGLILACQAKAAADIAVDA